MTVMFDRFFGLPQQVLRSGLWKVMRPGEKDLYVFLMAESERCCSRQLGCTDKEIAERVGVKARTLCNARKKLQERGLITCVRQRGNRYQYVICDPSTGQPYPGNPKERMVYVKKPQAGPIQSQPSAPLSEGHGLPGVFN